MEAEEGSDDSAQANSAIIDQMSKETSSRDSQCFHVILTFLKSAI